MEAGRPLKVCIAVFICKLIYFFGRRVGKGSSLPGKVVLRIFPDVLGRLKLPKTIIAVTGSNGKTTTTELIAYALKANGKSVGWNFEGSNQTEGIATLLLRLASFNGEVKCETIVMECDERYAKKIFEKVRPSILLVTNLCRDQLTRNGNPEFIMDCIYEAILAAGSDVKLVLNADDPYVSALIHTEDTIIPYDTLWFGVNAKSGTTDHTGMYDDGTFCPVCKARMTYDYRIIGHYGSYSCTACSLKRNEPDIEVTSQEDGSLLFKKQEDSSQVFMKQEESSHMFKTQEDSSQEPDDGLKLKVKLPGITNTYNFCSTAAVLKAVGLDVKDTIKALEGYELTGGRTMYLNLGNRNVMLLVAKHENTFAYDASLSWIVEKKKPCTVIILVDAISRKYFTSETSWFWDVDFGLLADDNIKNVVLAGRYVNELAMRFSVLEINKEKLIYLADPGGLRECIEKNTTGDTYAVTCFSDKAKILRAFKANDK